MKDCGKTLWKVGGILLLCAAALAALRYLAGRYLPGGSCGPMTEDFEY